MSKLVWDAAGDHLYETGVKNCALYPISTSGTTSGTYPSGVVWNGITAITEKPTGAEATPLYADDQKYLNLISIEEFEATVEAYTYPDEFAECDGSASLTTGVEIGQQNRKTFGLAYRTILGNDTANDDYGYKLHIIYGAVASPSEKAYATINDSPEAITFSWELKTTPVAVSGYKSTATVCIDSTKATVANLAGLEAVLFGADDFSESKTYAVGDIVNHSTGSGSTAVNTAYVCSTAVTSAGTWSASDWTEVGPAGPRLPLPDEIKTIMTPAN